MDLMADDEVGERLGLGPEPLSNDFDATVLAQACVGSRAPLKAILMNQEVVAGVGNIYASEALHLARLSPRRRASTLATATARPRAGAEHLADAVKAVLREAIARRTGHPYRDSRFRVYDLAGAVCPRRGCGGTIVRIVQSGRSSFYCPRCQR